jgi:hypothetical protein
MRAANLSEKVKPARMTKPQASAVIWLSGAVEDGAHRERDYGTWEARHVGVVPRGATGNP